MKCIRQASREAAKALAAELLKTAGPERLFWGSGWPFAACEDKVTYSDTICDFLDWIPDPAARREIDRVQVLFRLTGKPRRGPTSGRI